MKPVDEGNLIKAQTDWGTISLFCGISFLSVAAICLAATWLALSFTDSPQGNDGATYSSMLLAALVIPGVALGALLSVIGLLFRHQENRMKGGEVACPKCGRETGRTKKACPKCMPELDLKMKH